MPKILVVDDEEHIRLLYSDELNEAGYEVITAESGYKLLERIEEEKPDLVILDIKMVDYNGLDYRGGQKVSHFDRRKSRPGCPVENDARVILPTLSSSIRVNSISCLTSFQASLFGKHQITLAVALHPGSLPCNHTVCCADEEIIHAEPPRGFFAPCSPRPEASHPGSPVNPLPAPATRPRPQGCIS